MEEKAISRRSFMTGLAAAGLAGWLYDSDTLSARVIRGTFGDAARATVRIAPADLSGWTDKTLDVCWVGHATVLINFFGMHILTDPVLFNHIGAQVGMLTVGRKRLIAPALNPAALPRIDLLLLSHAHMDHLDLPSLADIPKSVPVITARGTSDLLAEMQFHDVREMGWGEREVVRGASGSLEVAGLEVKHWGARWSMDTYRGYNGYLIKRGGKTVLFGGDTAYTEVFRHVPCKRTDVAIMPIGCYGRGTGTHCTPEEAVRMADEARAEFIVPIHHSTFPLGREPISEPLERLAAAVAPDRVALSAVGEVWRCPV